MEEGQDRIAAAIELVRDAIDLFDQAAPGLATTAVDSPPMYAAAALRRATHLWLAGDAMVQQGMPAGVGVLARTSWETWLTGTYLLLGGHRALNAMANAQLVHDDKVARLNGMGEVPALVERRVELDRAERLRQVTQEDRNVDDAAQITFDVLDVENLSRLVGNLLAVDGRAEDVHGAYQVLYRSHSAWDVHGMAVLDGQLSYDDRSDRLTLKPYDRWMDPAASLAVVGPYLVLLEHYVFGAFDVDVAVVESLYEALMDTLGPDREGPSGSAMQA